MLPHVLILCFNSYNTWNLKKMIEQLFYQKFVKIEKYVTNKIYLCSLDKYKLKLYLMFFLNKYLL